MIPRLFASILGILAVGAALAIFLAAAPVGQGANAQIANVAVAVAAAVAVGSFAWRLMRKEAPIIWSLMLVGVGLYMVGELLWMVGDESGPAPVAMVAADAAYYAGYAFIVGALVLAFPGQEGRRDRTRHALDVLILALTLLGLLWLLGLRSVAGGHVDAATLIAIGYPALDIALASLALVIAGEVHRAHRPRAFLFVAAFLVWAVADFAYAIESEDGGFAAGFPLDALWLVGYLLLACTAWWTPAVHGRPGGAPRRFGNLVYVPIGALVAAAFADYLRSRPIDDLLHWIMLALVAALALRHVISTWELQTSNRELSGQAAQLREAQALAHIGSWTWDHRTDATWWSDEMYRIFTRRREDGPMGIEEALAAFTPPSRALLQRELQDTIETGRPYSLDLELEPGYGAQWVMSRATALMHDGAAQMLKGTVQDITDRKVAQLSRDALQRRFQRIVENTPEGIFRTTPEGRLDYANPGAAAILGFATAEQLLEEIDDVKKVYADPADRLALLDEVKKPVPGPVQVRFTRRDGALIWVEIHAALHFEDGKPFIEGTFRDLSAERAQQETAYALAAIVDSSDDAIYSMGLDGIVRTWNRAAQKLYGYRAAEAVGASLMDLIVPEGRSETYETLLARLRRGRPVVRHDALHRHKDGSPIDVSVSMVGILDASGNVAAVSATAYDISYRLRAEEAARARLENEHLKQLDRTLRDFINAAAHDLNQPLTPMRLALATLEQSLQAVPPAAQRSLATFKRSVDRMALLVADLLDVARLESGTLQFEFQPVDMAPLLGEVHDFFEAAATEQGLTWDVEASAGLVVSADAGRLVQVLNNLVGNAFKYTASGGSVHVHAATRDKQVRIEVVDTGKGLTPEQITRLFRPFSQVHTHLPGAPKGTGLGLYISKGIIEEHGGRVGVESAGPGQGATFWFEVPCVAGNLVGTPVRDEPGVPPGA